MYWKTVSQIKVTANERLAIMELKLILAMFVWSFDAELIDDKEPFYKEKFVVMRGPLHLRLRKSNMEIRH